MNADARIRTKNQFNIISMNTSGPSLICFFIQMYALKINCQKYSLSYWLDGMGSVYSMKRSLSHSNRTLFRIKKKIAIHQLPSSSAKIERKCWQFEWRWGIDWCTTTTAFLTFVLGRNSCSAILHFILDAPPDSFYATTSALIIILSVHKKYAKH